MSDSSKNKNQIIKDTVIFSGASYIAQFLGVINSVLLRRFLGPEQMGIFVLLKVVMNYCGYSSLGTTKAAFREIPFFKGKGNQEEAELIKNQVFSFSIINSIIPALLIVGYVALKREDYSPVICWGLMVTALVVIMQRIYDYYLTLLRANKQFVLLSKIKIVSILVDLAVTIGLVWKWGLYGLYAGLVLSFVFNFTYAHLHARYEMKWCWNSKKLKGLLKIGIPLLLLSFSYEILRSIDKVMIGRFINLTELGFYSIATMTQTYLLAFPTIISTVLYPRLQEKYGESGSAEGIKNYLILPLQILSALTPIFIALAYVVVPYVVWWVLPDYIPGTAALKIFLFGTFFASLGFHTSTFLVTLNKQMKVIPLVVAAILISILLNWYVISLGWGIEGVALATVLTFVVFSIAIVSYAMLQVGHLLGVFLFWVKALIPFVFMLGVVWFVEKWVVLDDRLIQCLVQSVVVCVASLPLVFYINHKTQFVSRLISFKNK